MPRTLLVVALALPLFAGCDSDCADASRVNGTYAMWHDMTNAGTGGTATADENYPSYQVFSNGWSKWKVTSGSGQLNVDITDVAEAQGDFNDGAALTQSFVGSLTPGDDNCNVFALHLEGDFETSVSTTHSFVYDATVMYLGDHLSGTFTYTDTYTGTADDGSTISGGITDAAGDVNGTLQMDQFDTGFVE